MNPSSKQQNWLHRNPAGSCRTQQLGSGKPSKAGFDETQQGSSEPSLIGFGETQLVRSRRNPARETGWVRQDPGLLGLTRPWLAGLDGTQQIWVSLNPARLGLVEPSLAGSPLLGSDETQQAGFR
ncbi:hypothetical protein SLEP1_g24052 [Rubroshorea leprosula]|uniref:Uncharacterized protein n=1 Tax=Rubroshorea leprosula TaxID=152421 RepID=A0AAV5JEC3_9ROSI|nr:hypothetical protein SLEP1_g24052 [Rubroshorea leprosula]